MDKENLSKTANSPTIVDETTKCVNHPEHDEEEASAKKKSLEVSSLEDTEIRNVDRVPFKKQGAIKDLEKEVNGTAHAKLVDDSDMESGEQVSPALNLTSPRSSKKILLKRYSEEARAAKLLKVPQVKEPEHEAETSRVDDANSPVPQAKAGAIPKKPKRVCVAALLQPGSTSDLDKELDDFLAGEREIQAESPVQHPVPITPIDSRSYRLPERMIKKLQEKHPDPPPGSPNFAINIQNTNDASLDSRFNQLVGSKLQTIGQIDWSQRWGEINVNLNDLIL